jgi:Ca2+-binding RTX toxin-like protein
VAPGNDGFAARITVASVPFSDSQSTVDATTESGEPNPACGPIGKTVWYQFTPASDVVLRAATLGSDFDTMLGIWSGTDLASLSPVACSDDVINAQSIAVFSAEGGVTYVFQAGGYQDRGGALTFHLRSIDAGTISGTVTDQVTGLPLADVCVDVIDADFFSFTTTVTDAAGRYRAPVRSGSYLVVFYDWCDQTNEHRTEWYNGKPDIESADEVAVTAPAEVSGIDASLAPSCPGYGDFASPQFVGTPGPDEFIGTEVPEIFCGFGGGDQIRGGGSRDRIIGGDGADRIAGGAGSDYLFGGDGADRMSGGPDNDHVSGGDGGDRLAGGPGHDFCDGGKARDRAARSCERTDDVP